MQADSAILPLFQGSCRERPLDHQGPEKSRPEEPKYRDFRAGFEPGGVIYMLKKSRKRAHFRMRIALENSSSASLAVGAV